MLFLNAVLGKQYPPSFEEMLGQLLNGFWVSIVTISLILLLYWLIKKEKSNTYSIKINNELTFYNHQDILLQERATLADTELSYIPLNTQLGKSKVVQVIICALVVAMFLIPFSEFII